MSIEQIKNKLTAENKKEQEAYGSGFLLSPAFNIDDKIKSIYSLFNIKLSNDYLELLNLSNGFSINGLNIYGISAYNDDYFIDSIIDINNEFWTEPTLRKYFSYGDESSTRLVFNIEQLRYEAVDSVTWEMIEYFPSFNELLSYIFEQCNIFD
ncbi:hypothetical protein A6E13_15675 [Aliivibrio fischeri]|uniref:YrhA family protein n=1 Tax=Aliivibrio fischeri TaxID=668 RepID=UPI00080DCA01|nr:YrhA family protein [Aliivibrio fischeri]OCH32012.1 hypothetical protein A6E13_15675 [Aliivibrio fischeri]